MILTLKRTPGIYLVGFMGSGKSTVGRMLSKELGWPFADLDHDIEQQQDRSISDIFAQDGEPAFRAIEAAALQKRVNAVRTGRPLVLALGGGTYTVEANRTLLRHNGVTIWIDVPLDIVRQRIGHSTHRPLAQDPARLEALYHSRRDTYAEADYRVTLMRDNSQDALNQILALPLF